MHRRAGELTGQAMAVLVAQEPVELSCLLIPLQRGGQLLLPSVCVAEVLPWRRIKSIADGPDWCLGALPWRGEVVPVVRFEALNGPLREPSASGRCLAVMNRTQSGAEFSFYALAAGGLPRMVQLAGEDLSATEESSGKGIARAVRIGTEIAWIPDLAYLEGQVCSLTR